MAFPEGVHQVEVIRFGNSRLITPVGRRWGEFFVNGPRVFKGLCISMITPGELLYGVEKSARRSQNLQAVQQFTARLEVLPFSAVSWLGLAMPCAAYDMLIAAHARSEGLMLVTNNVREFKRMPGLRVDNWV